MHFYFCLSAALKLARKHEEADSCIQQNMFILRWLKNAKHNKIFDRNVSPEIEWLQGYIQSRGPFFRYAEMLIENIYTTGQKLLYKEEP